MAFPFYSFPRPLSTGSIGGSRCPFRWIGFDPTSSSTGAQPHAEDGWDRVRIGEVEFRFVKPCARCVVTTVDQATGERKREPLRTLSTYRTVDGQVLFGQNLVHEGRGVVRIGDPVDVLDRARDA